MRQRRHFGPRLAFVVRLEQLPRNRRRSVRRAAPATPKPRPCPAWWRTSDSARCVVSQVAHRGHARRRQDLLPGPSAVGRAVDASASPVSRRPPRRRRRVWILGSIGILLIRCAGSGRSSSTSCRRRWTNCRRRRRRQSGHRCRRNNVGIGRRDDDRADAVDVRQLVDDRQPRDAGTGRLPHAAHWRADVNVPGWPMTPVTSRNRRRGRGDVAPFEA